MSWNREEIKVLLEEYRKWPNLYNPKTANYKNRGLRQNALEAIYNAVKIMKPSLKSIEEMHAKFLSLKSYCVNEHNKHLASIHSGMSVDEVYVPSIWYYDLLKYVLVGNVARRGIDILEDDPLSENREEEYSEVDDNTENPTSASTSRAGSSGEETPQKPAKKRKRAKGNQATDDAIQQASGALKIIALQIAKAKNLPTRSTNAMFGEFVTSKLDAMTIPNVRLEVEQKITQILYEGLKKCNE